MRKNKIFSFITSVTLCIGAMTGIIANAEEYPIGSLPEPGKDFYTLEQLFEMSDEEFLALNGRIGSGQVYYNEIKADTERVDQVFDLIEYGGISGQLARWYYDEDKKEYTEGVTEHLIDLALGDAVEYEISSPSFDPDSVYSNILWVTFPDYELPAEYFDITNEQIMDFAKCFFCVDQVVGIGYQNYGSLLAPAPEPSTEPITEPITGKVTLLGDVNLDDVVGLADLITVSKYNLNSTLFPLKDATAAANADMNNDGVIDSLDEDRLIEFNLSAIDNL